MLHRLETFRSGRFDPGFRNELTAIMFNPFIKYKGLEFMGTLEFISGKADAETDTRSFTQYAGEAIYRFGKTGKYLSWCSIQFSRW